jgi:hypothetical protein
VATDPEEAWACSLAARVRRTLTETDADPALDSLPADASATPPRPAVRGNGGMATPMRCLKTCGTPLPACAKVAGRSKACSRTNASRTTRSLANGRGTSKPPRKDLPAGHAFVSKITLIAPKPISSRRARGPRRHPRRTARRQRKPPANTSDAKRNPARAILC